MNNEKKITSRKVILTSFFVDVLDIFLSLVVAILSGSVIMVSQVLEGFSDLASSALLLIGHNRSMQKEDRTHPFGYGREIYFWTLLAALFMFGITSTFSFYLGFRRFMEPVVVHDVGAALFVLAITLFTNFYAFFLSYKRLLKNRSFLNIVKIFYKSSLVETKTTFTLDLMGTIASFLGLASLFMYVLTGDGRFDGIGAMVIGLSLGVFSIFLVLGIKDVLVGKSASPETEEKIKDAALSVEKVEKVSDLKTMHIGSEKLLVSLDAGISGKLKKKELKEIIDQIEWKIREVVPSAKYVFVELGG